MNKLFILFTVKKIDKRYISTMKKKTVVLEPLSYPFHHLHHTHITHNQHQNHWSIASSLFILLINNINVICLYYFFKVSNKTIHYSIPAYVSNTFVNSLIKN